ncbi:hypothetical protein COK19_04045 [Bacillus cereus]|uniref:hypothetical protein n=1 Tax=Bacillus cereus TaxID=1396 RepID=UPI000BF4CD53|nr:hypothetical protein [Bacillus cereus]PFR30840.1 hypothetical protein COK19_04045 [Bacillus cereus]
MIDPNMYYRRGLKIKALPNWKNAKIIYPSQNFSLDWKVNQIYPATKRLAKVRKFIMRFAAGINLIKGKIMSGKDEEFRDFVTSCFPNFSECIILVGTPGPTQKLTIQLLDLNYSVIGYLKFSTKELGIKSIYQEYEVLKKLNGIDVPIPLKIEKLNGGIGMIITPVEGNRLEVNIRPSKEVVESTRLFVQEQYFSIEEHPWIKNMQENMVNKIQPYLYLLSNRNWPISIQHGDFVPWNIIQRADKSCVPIDWEYGNVNSFPYLDLIYYIIQVGALIKKWNQERVLQEVIKFFDDMKELALTYSEVICLTYFTVVDCYEKSLLLGSGENDVLQVWRKELERTVKNRLEEL